MHIKIILASLLIGCSVFAQKAKKPQKSAQKVTSLSKSENLSAILIEHAGPAVFYVISGSGKVSDSLMIKTIIDKSPDRLPKDVKLKKFKASGVSLILISWTEKNTMGDPKTKLENIVETHSEIWDPETKSRILENVQKVNNITEIVWLDANKTASKTVDRIRREGFEFTLAPDGSVLLKNKTQQESMNYDAGQKKFMAAKTSATKKK